jgi:hypothetical protein
VREVAGARRVQRDAGLAGGGEDLLVAHRPAGLDDGAHAGVEQHLQAVGKGKKASDAATDPRARSPARATASRAASTRLTCPMPTPTVAPPEASRIALLLTARTARQAKASSASARRAASPAAASTSTGRRPGAQVVGALQQDAAAHLPQLEPRLRVAAGAQHRIDGLRASTSTAPSS